MITDRKDESVTQAYAIGAVACAVCQQVHIDLIDDQDNIVASASINFDQWRQMVVDVGEALEEIEGGVPTNGVDIHHG